MVCDKLHDHFDHVPVWQQTHKLTGEAVVPFGIIGCCEIKKTQYWLSFSSKSSPQCPESTR